MAESPKDEAPEDKNDLDPELIKLPRARTRIRPVMALAIVGICLTLSLRMAADLEFSWQSETPVPVANLAALSEDFENQFIEIDIRPDRPQALRVVPSGKTSGMVLVPVLGSQQSLWVLLPATPWTGDEATDERHRGRLSKLSDMDFHDALDSYLDQGNSVPRPISLPEIRAVLSGAAEQVHDAAGDAFSVSPSTFVRIEEVAVDTARILAVSTDPYADEASWRLALQTAGILPAGHGAVQDTPSSWTFDVPAPNGVQAIRDALVAAGLFAASASEITATREGTWSELSLDGEDLLLGKAKVGYRSRHVSLRVVRPLPDNAYLLNTTEKPGTYWYLPTLYALLASFAAIFLFGLYRSLRR